MNLAPLPDDFDSWVEHLAVPHRHKRAKWHLMLSGSPALPAIRRGLQHPDPAVRRSCTNILDHLVDEESLPDLIAALDDDDPIVRGRALHALACDQCKEGACRPGEELFVPRAVEILENEPLPRLRAAAVDALGKVVHRRPEVAELMSKVAANDPDRMVRKMAGWYAPGGPRFERTKPRGRRSVNAI